ncbi:hypothetical protein CL617_01545 [archaeon]|nr:hypothetical protein [archaeon]|tara:strand:- start:7871 stop:8392 length:522 start_codon:yes stop_codon:yes gene_type:complete
MESLEKKLIIPLIVGSSLLFNCEDGTFYKEATAPQIPEPLPKIAENFSDIYLFGEPIFDSPLEIGKTSKVTFILRPLIDLDSLDLDIGTDFFNIDINGSERSYLTSTGYTQELKFNHGSVEKGDTLKYNLSLEPLAQGKFRINAFVQAKKDRYSGFYRIHQDLIQGYINPIQE